MNWCFRRWNWDWTSWTTCGRPWWPKAGCLRGWATARRRARRRRPRRSIPTRPMPTSGNWTRSWRRIEEAADRRPRRASSTHYCARKIRSYRPEHSSWIDVRPILNLYTKDDDVIYDYHKASQQIAPRLMPWNEICYPIVRKPLYSLNHNIWQF